MLSPDSLESAKAQDKAKISSRPKAQLSEKSEEIARLAPQDALARFESAMNGIGEAQAAAARATFGPNSVAKEEKKGLPRQILERMINPLNLMMLSLVLIDVFALDDPSSGMLVGGMIVLSVALSLYQENRSSHAAEKLQALVGTTCTVLRPDDSLGASGGEKRVEIPIGQLVPGDVVALAAGDLIPADVRLLAGRDLFLDQAALTGESMPVEKFPNEVKAGAFDDALSLPNMAFMGSHVTSGTGRALVVATGLSTYFGSLAHAIVATRAATSFEKGTTRFTWLMIGFMAVMAPLVFVINGYMKGDWMEAFVFAIAVAVGLTPEMLPMIVTVNLSKGAMAIAKKKVIVKRLNSIQNFGAMDVLCTDKTGTLTQDKVILKKHLNLKGEECDEVLSYAYLNSFFQTGLKNLLDVAVLEHVDLAEKLQIEKGYARIDEIPFDFERRRLSVVLAKDQARHILICKGAVEEVMDVCTRGEVGGIVFPLDDTHKKTIDILKRDLNEDGFRVVAVASKTMPTGQESYSVKDESDLTLLGFIAFLDPPKDSAAPALATLKDYGVAVKILTGDNDIVTLKICRDVGLAVAGTLLGREIEAMDDATLAQKVEATTVFAKLSPAQKARVIDALHKNGHVVGYLGDGINDGPALKVADVGISVDTAVDIAKESAAIILLEKSLAVLGDGVIEGRKVFGNITKYIRMGASSSFGNMFSMIGASALLPFLPMAPVQVLANSLLYDFSQVAIPTDQVDPEYLTKPRKWDIGIIAKFMLVMGPISSIFDYATFALLYYVFGANAPADAAFFQTGWFVESILSQTLIIHIIRTNRIPFVQSWASGPMIVTSLLICFIGAWLPFSPFAPVFGFTTLPWIYGPCMVVIVGSYMALAFAAKLWFTRSFERDLKGA